MKNYPGEYKHPHEIAPNKVLEDGDMKGRKRVDNNTAFTVSPFHAEFRSQIEDGIWPHVKAFNDKGYFTMSSCEGHEDDGPPFVILAVTSTQARDYIKSELSGMYGVNVEKPNDLFNVEYDYISESVTYVGVKERDKKEEARWLNKLFLQNVDEYFYIRVYMDGFWFEDKISYKIVLWRVLNKIKNLRPAWEI